MSSRPGSPSLLDGLIAALLALAALVAATGGFDIEWGPFSLRSHSAWRVLAIALVPIGVRAWMLSRAGHTGPGSGFPDPVAVGLLTLTLLSIGYWFTYLLTSVGGADLYGYASAARQLASGRLLDPSPIAAWLSSPNRFGLVSALGWTPAASGGGIVPAYPLGLPVLMAVFSAIGGSNAIYLVSPVMGLLTLWLVFRLARSWTDERTAWLATAIVAWNPVFLMYAKQPMSDVPATAWMMLALYCAVGPGFRAGEEIKKTSETAERAEKTPGHEAGGYSAIVAGIAAGAAFFTRPALILAAAVVPLLAIRGPNRYHRLLLSSIGVAAAAILQASLQGYMFGSPFASGYGSADALFSWQALSGNVDIYARQAWRALGGPWLVALAAGAWFMRGRQAAGIAALAAAVAMPYLFYGRYDHWETLRFLLPAIVPLSMFVATGVTRVAGLARVPMGSAVIIVLFASAFALRSERLMRESSVWNIQAMEARYPLAGQWFEANTPPGSVVLANQHSGSLRWYSGRQTLRWDLMTAAELVRTVQELERHGATVYAALEGTEQQVFDAKFSTELARLSVDPVGRVHNVNFLLLKSR